VIGESDVTPDTIFTAILFSDLAQENLGFYWTTSLSCSSPIFDACSLYSDVDTDSRDSCKFVFTPCSENWVAGTTLYFIVGNYLNALTPYAQQAFQRSVEYTINWKLERASPVYEGITNIETVERYLSAQQYIDVPNDDTISRVRVSSLTLAVEELPLSLTLTRLLVLVVIASPSLILVTLLVTDFKPVILIMTVSFLFQGVM